MIPARPLRIMYPASMRMGGAERQMMLLAKYLPRDRFEISFVILGSTTPLAEAARGFGATIHTLEAPRRAQLSPPMLVVHAARAVVRYIALSRRERYDIVDAWLYHGYWLAGLSRPIGRLPILIAGRRSLSGFKRHWNPVRRAFDAVARRQSDLFIANSHAVAADVVVIEGIDPRSIRVIHNGVEIPELEGRPGRDRARAALGVPDDALVVGCVGSFKLGKGQPAVIRSMRQVVERVGAAYLVLAGDGPQRPAVERLAAEVGLDRVRFLGAVADARELYPGFDVLVSASEAEGLPNVILEAAAAGRPIVATDAGGTREIIEDGVSGVLLPIGDQAALTAAIVRVLEDPALAERLGQAAREHVIQAFGIDRFVDETAAMYEEMAAHRGR